MGSKRESSVVFSLQRLLELERDRVDEEAENERRRVEAERAAREQARQRMNEERERAEREKRERDEAERRRQLEGAARIEAIRQAELERVRMESEHRARLEAERISREQAHERALVDSARRHKHNVRLAFVLMVAAASLCLFAMFAFLRAHASESSALEAERARLSQEYSGVIAGFRAQVKRTSDNLDAARQQIEQAKNAARAAPVASDKRVLAPPTRTLTAPKHAPRERKGPDCDPHDPMCGF